MLSISLPHLCEGASQCNAGTTQAKNQFACVLLLISHAMTMSFVGLARGLTKPAGQATPRQGSQGWRGPGGSVRGDREGRSWAKGCPHFLEQLKILRLGALLNTHIRAVASCFVSIFKWCNHWRPWVVLVTIGSVVWETAMAPELCKLT